ncbi:MAG: RDD family protein [Chloroflexota bacterium]
MGLPGETLRIETPENVAFGYEVAGIGSRFLAALVDTLIITVLQAVLFLAVVALMGNYSASLLESGELLSAWVLAFIGLFLFFVYWGYYIYFEMAWNGQSPGKRLVGLRVICVDGTPITLAESVIRNLVRLVDMLPSMYGVGVISMFINSQSRRLGDLAAGTLVVYDRAAVTLETLEKAARSNRVRSQTSPYSPPVQAAAGYPTHLLRSSDLHMAEEFLQRRAALVGSQALAQRIARALYARMGLPEPDPYADAVSLISEIVRAARQQPAGARPNELDAGQP